MEISKSLHEITNKDLTWKKITKEGLDVDYTIFLPKSIADFHMNYLEETIEYESPENSRVRIFGKWHEIPRKQVAFGDSGTHYTFSGLTLPAKPWPSSILCIRNMLFEITGYKFNFVLVNRYRCGSDHMGEHKDNEPELDPDAPIASVSLGQSRDFVLKHGDARKKGAEKKDIPTVKIHLEHGSLLMMNPPTNKVWYHSLPPRKSATGVRINLTFRCIKNIN